MKVHAFLGFIGSGKDTAATYLVNNYGYVPLAFADSLKDAVATIFCWDRSMIEGNTKESRIWREQIDQWWANRLGIPHLTPRWVLQNFGTELVRKHLHTDIWIFNMEKRIEAMGENAKVIITDARFPNEISLARKYNGKVFRVKRGPEPVWYETAKLANIGSDSHRLEMIRDYKVHESEWAWLNENIDRVIENDGTLDDLTNSTKKLVEDFGLE